jgi:DNA-binding PadR family transcriptional regulator
MSGKDANPEELLPLSPPVFNILLALGDRPLHGYAIIQEFERKTGQVGALLPGSLYNTIARMLKSGFIEETDERPPAEEDDGRRRYYRVTRLGKSVAAAESERLRKLLTVARDEACLADSV